MALTSAEKQRAYRERLKSDPERLGNVTEQNRLRKQRERARRGNVTGNVTGPKLKSLEDVGIRGDWTEEDVREYLSERLGIADCGGG